MGLDTRGDISVVELVVYIPLGLVAAYLIIRPGSLRKTGWFYLMLLSIVRIVGSILHIVTETSANPSVGLFIATAVLESAGLSPLMLSTLSFLGIVVQESPMEKTALVNYGFIGLHLTNMVALGLATLGGIKLGNAQNQDDVNSANTFKRIGVILFLVVFVLIALVHVYFWTQKSKIMKYRRMLLAGISCALPFLLTRVLYTVFSAASPTGIPGSATPPPTNAFSQFNYTTGSWAIYFVMSVLTEIVVVCIYLFCGMKLPLSQDYAIGKNISGFDSDVELNKDAHQPLM
ncbi:hypothetical protein EIP91_009686 [Steccherinum ochraceum]|uniref:DUF7702 domain-containing protein n=1 Tax=Steccherinum ochraceum TaxID=92696 RepID=A0A4R0RTC1_9APHY|nr:hypothetical protein EIP91_009686 [Steccherinum ochraceum]